MLFSSAIFIFGFLPICLLIYYIIPSSNRGLRNLFLLMMSLGFYSWGEPIFVLIMVLSIIVNFIFGLLVEKYTEQKNGKTILVMMLIFNLSMLFVFKYANFFISNINNIFNINLKIPNIALFPQLIAGPIVRYKTIAEQINYREENFDDFSEGVRRFIIGLSKKVLISNNLALIADKAFSLLPSNISISFAWFGAIAYSLQIFFDFSGYSDMAIGLGKMFGFHFLENFNYPYISKSISEFWRRWHISLGSWFRDYVYFPLGGSKKGNFRTIINLLVVWFLTGFWHGANWTYMAWGIYFFIFIALEKVLKNKEKNLFRFNLIKHAYTLIVVVFGWVLFRADSIGNAIEYIKSMLGLSNNIFIDDLTVLYFKENLVYLILGLSLSIPIIDFIKKKYLNLKNKTRIKYSIFKQYAYISAYTVFYICSFIITISYIIKGAYNPFIYFNF